MAMARWWRLLSLLVLVASAWACGTAHAQETMGDCTPNAPKGSTVTATLRLEQHKRSVPRVTSDMTVRVPKQWPLAKHLTFGERSKQYRQAMRCLLLGNETPGARTEWRPHDPVVTATDKSVEVHYVAYNWITREKPVLVGPWQVIPAGKTWMIYLWPPTLRNIRWDEIKADLGGLDFNDLTGRASSSTETDVFWKEKKPEDVQVQVDPPWQRRLPVTLEESPWITAGIASWWVCASVLIAVAAIRVKRAEAAAVRQTARQPPEGMAGRQPAVGVSDTDQRRVTRFTHTLLEWAGLSAGVALALLLFVQEPDFSPATGALLYIPAGLALLLAARPWSPGPSPTAPGALPDEPARPGDIQRRQARAVVAPACAVAGIGLLVIPGHDVFGLPWSLGPVTTTAWGRTGLALSGLATVWLWLAALVAWAWRFAREGELLRERWTRQWDEAPAQCVTIVGCLLANVAMALLACAWWSHQRRWARIHWLVDQQPTARYNAYLTDLFERFSYTDLRCTFAYSWVLTGVALLALLRLRNMPPRAEGRRRYGRFPLGPSRPDILLIVSLFAFFVGVRAAKFAGASGLYGIWLGLNILALYFVLALGRRWSVLSQLGEQFCMVRLGTEQHQSELREKAHQYRNANHQMHLLDRGNADGVTFGQLKEDLHQLHQWLVSACEGNDPPEHISVLDVTLAWGPEGHWWSNAVRAARLAFWFGAPATALLLYYQTWDPYARQEILDTPIGLPEFAANLILYQLAWAVAGFTLGALWRLLPGHRSQARAWILTAAYGLPTVLAAALVRIMDTDHRQLLLYAALLLVVLTLTSIWMDMATFREERQYWPSRFALLLSVYQMRGLSGQITWILAQVVAVVTIFTSLTR
ncbi:MULTISPECIES: DUF6185 family protein [Streptomyces]|uniref:DUF6185 family protein n=1 Tax=Streptomyces TaxID=1883 RepID=UPI00073DEA96|nr:DUF6185 family protein [Streptomyces sp. EAS-AB2608]MYU29849.1 hypothetical protein [Streptomyces sp. SID7810]BCM69291.1 hypothetical protein EASAB2608_04625 [Streptomyces sp. EAS-AB2608]CUW30908.1 hypothetical protein TUE45_05643 [Streptomyces reticuli]